MKKLLLAICIILPAAISDLYSGQMEFKMNKLAAAVNIGTDEESLEKARALLDTGEDVNARPANGGTALLIASLRGLLNTAEFLISRGADVNLRDGGGFSALMKARSMDMVTLLLIYKAEINAADATKALLYNYTPDPKVVKYYLNKGADINAGDDSGSTALITAASFREKEIVALLLQESAAVNAGDSINGDTALMGASFNQNMDIAGMLIDAGADPGIRNKCGRTALMKAMESRHGEKKLLELLIANGADVNAKDNDGKTALMSAHELETIKFLTAMGADINARDNNGRTVLMHLHAGDLDIIKFLAEKGADINAKDNNGITVLGFFQTPFPEKKFRFSTPAGNINFLKDAGAK